MTRLCLLLGLSALLSAGHRPIAASDLQTDDENCKCTLKKPASVQVLEAGPDYFLLNWSEVPGAAYYKVKAYEFTTKKLTFSRTVAAKPGQNSAYVMDLPSGSYNFRVFPVCSNGMVSAIN